MNRNVFLLIGDAFLIEEKTEDILNQLEKKSEGLFKQTFHLKDTPLQEIISQARTLPFLVSAQVFRLVGADLLKKEDVESVKEYIQAPAAKTFLILEASALDKRSTLITAVQNAGGQVITFQDGAKKSASSRLIREKLRQFKKTMTPEAQKRLESQAGEEPAFLDSILNQIITYAQEEDEITEEMVERFEEKLGAVNVFQLVDAISARDARLALKLFHEYVENNPKDILSFVGLLHWQLRRIWQASVMLSEGQPEFAILKRCKVFSKQKPFMAQARGVSRKKIELAIERLFQLDCAVKTGLAEDRAALEKWVVETTTQ